MPPSLGAGSIMFSGCPSVRPKPEIPSFDLYMGPLVHPTNRDRFTACASVRLSVRPERFLVICRRTHGGNGLKFCMLMYLDHVQKKLFYGHGLLIFLILALFWLSETGQIWVSGYFPENRWRKWPDILHADVSWPPSEPISLWPRSYDFSNFGTILTEWNGSNLGFPGISRRTHGGNGLKFCMLMYLDHLQNCVVQGHGLLIFL